MCPKIYNMFYLHQNIIKVLRKKNYTGFSVRNNKLDRNILQYPYIVTIIVWPIPTKVFHPVWVTIFIVQLTCPAPIPAGSGRRRRRSKIYCTSLSAWRIRRIWSRNRECPVQALNLWLCRSSAPLRYRSDKRPGGLRVPRLPRTSSSRCRCRCSASSRPSRRPGCHYISCNE